MAPYITVRHTESRTLYFITDKGDITTYLEEGTLRGHWAYECYPYLNNTVGQEHFYGEELFYICKGGMETLTKPPEKSLSELVEEKGGLNEDGTFKDSLEVKEPKRAEYYIDGVRNPLYFKYDEKLGVHRCYVRVLEDEYDQYEVSEVYKAITRGRSLVLVSTEGYEDFNGLAMYIKGLHDDCKDECELLTLEEGERLFKAKNEGAKIVAITDDHPPAPDDEVLDGQPLDEGCTDNTCSLDACSGGDCTDAGVMATKIAQQEAQKFAVGAREMKEGEEGIKINLGFNPSGEETVSVNFDTHYKEAKTDKVGEPIDVIEALEVRLINAGVDINEACNICRGLKYVLRGSFKEGEDVQKELRKFYNYTHRARTGEWLGGR